MAVGAPSVKTVATTGMLDPVADQAAATAVAQAVDPAAPQGVETDRGAPTNEAGGSGAPAAFRSGATTLTETLNDEVRPSGKADVVKHPRSTAHVRRRATMALP